MIKINNINRKLVILMIMNSIDLMYHDKITIRWFKISL